MLDKRGAAYYGRNVDRACEVSAAWDTFKQTEMPAENWAKFDQFNEIKADGGTTCFDHYPSRESAEFKSFKDDLSPDKPVVFFPINVPWDNAIHNECYVADDLIDLIRKTLMYFNENPQFQLVIKAHPMEAHFDNYEHLPHSMLNIIRDLDLDLGSNIKVIGPHSEISSFDLYPLADLGIVHSSRSGVELAMYGVPTIVTANTHYRGKGFVIDVNNETDYFETISSCLAEKQSEDDRTQRRNLARKYWMLYGFHGFMDLELFRGGWKEPVEVLFDNLEAIMPGRNEKLDFLCDSVISDKPLFGPNRWPPTSL